MKILRISLAVLAVLLVLIQLVPTGHDNPLARSSLGLPSEVEPILRRACFDCHSNETRWPWYSHVAPLSWWIVGHVSEGRESLNFSEVDQLGPFRLNEIREVVQGGEMPLSSYLLLHSEAKLSEQDKEILTTWAANGMTEQ